MHTITMKYYTYTCVYICYVMIYIYIYTQSYIYNMAMVKLCMNQCDLN